MNLYRKVIIGIIEKQLEEMRQCQKYSESWVDSGIYIHTQCQVSILIAILETVEKVNTGIARSDALPNLEYRFGVIREELNV